MGKDGCGGGGGDETRRVYVKEPVETKTTHDVLIEVLCAMDKELERLHDSLSNDASAADHETQGQISIIVNELCRLSESLGDAVVENANS